MRARFLAAAGPDPLVQALAETQGWPASLPYGWKGVLRRPGLIVFGREGEPVLPFSRGAVLGTLFGRSDGQPVRSASPSLQSEIDESGGQYLIERYWGAWFAIFLDEDGHWALRDPSAFCPVYFRTSEGVSLYVSDLAALLEFGLDPGGADVEFLRHWLAFPHLRTARTGLKDMRELLPGTRRVVTSDSDSTSTAWTPWTFAAADRQITDFDSAAEHVREEALRTIPAQVRDQGPLLLELSGGLDSSIIAATLKAGDQPFRTVNFVTRSAEGDERRYARAVAAATSEHHFELDEIEGPIELGVPGRRRLRPGLSPVMAPLHRQFAAHGEAIGTRAFLTGAGGDNVFCYLTTAAPLLDAWRRLGPATALGMTLNDVSEMCGCNIWTTARFGLRKAAREVRGTAAWRRDIDFLLPDAAPAFPEPHPWLNAPPGALAGKREHIAALLRIQHVIDPETRLARLPFIHPLIAQPLMELCLRIPTWLWVRGGHNRAVARRAFRGLLPDEVLDRRSKGRLESLCLRAYQRHRREIAELLLDGALREANLIDPTELGSYLEREGPPPDYRYFRIFELLSSELWLRSCQS